MLPPASQVQSQNRPSSISARICSLGAGAAGRPDRKHRRAQDSQSRRQWQAIVDPYESGFYNYRYQPSDNGYFKNAKPKTKSDLIEYDFDRSGSLKVPGDWNTQSDQLFFYEGTIWYKKSFDYQRKPNTRLFVYFGAANYLADVYLNGEKVGQHEGGFTPFNFEITKLVRDTGNFLVVKVDNKRRRDAVPTLMTDWWNYGGLTREVKLIETPTTFVHDYLIQLRKAREIASAAG